MTSRSNKKISTRSRDIRSEENLVSSSTSAYVYMCHVCRETFESELELVNHASDHVTSSQLETGEQCDTSSVDLLTFSICETKVEPDDEADFDKNKDTEQVLSSGTTSPEVFAIKEEVMEDGSGNIPPEGLRYLSVPLRKLPDHVIQKYISNDDEEHERRRQTDKSHERKTDEKTEKPNLKPALKKVPSTRSSKNEVSEPEPVRRQDVKSRTGESSVIRSLFCRLCMERFTDKRALQEHGRKEHSIPIRVHSRGTESRLCKTISFSSNSKIVKSSSMKARDPKSMKANSPKFGSADTKPTGSKLAKTSSKIEKSKLSKETRNDDNEHLDVSQITSRDAVNVLRDVIKKNTSRMSPTSDVKKTPLDREDDDYDPKNEDGGPSDAKNERGPGEAKKERGYRCVPCGKVFKVRSKLTRHQNTIIHKTTAWMEKAADIGDNAIGASSDVTEEVPGVPDVVADDVDELVKLEELFPEDEDDFFPAGEDEWIPYGTREKKSAQKSAPARKSVLSQPSVADSEDILSLTNASDDIIDDVLDDVIMNSNNNNINNKKAKAGTPHSRAVKECLSCGKSFPKVYGLTRHKLTHTYLFPDPDDEPHDDHVTDPTDHVTERDHVAVQTKGLHGLGEHVCGYCDEVFDSSEILNKHNAMIHPQCHVSSRTKFFRIMPCQLCPRKFASKDAWLVHIRSHTDDLTFKCHVCHESGFRTAADILSHVAEHKFEKRYRCNICNGQYVYAICRDRCEKSHEPTTIMPKPRPIKKPQVIAQSDSTEPDIILQSVIDDMGIEKPTTLPGDIVEPRTKTTDKKVVVKKGVKSSPVGKKRPAYTSLGQVIGIGERDAKGGDGPNDSQEKKDGATEDSNGEKESRVGESDDCSDLGAVNPSNDLSDPEPDDGHVATADDGYGAETEIVPKTEPGEGPDSAAPSDGAMSTVPPDSTTSDNVTVKKEKKKRPPMKCPECDKLYRTKNYLELHLKTAHHNDQVKPHACDFCSKSFHLHCQYRKHVIKSHGFRVGPRVKVRKEHTGFQERVACIHCGKMISQGNMNRHTKLYHSGVEYVCEHCGDTFLRQMAYYQHLENNHTSEEERKFQCEFCQLTFKYEPLYKKHYGRRRCKANVKAASLSNAYELNVLKCLAEDCGLVFETINDLQNHERQHKKAWMKCPYCERKFLRSSRLYEHINLDHDGSDLNRQPVERVEVKYEPPIRLCEICGESFTCPKYLRIHKMVVHQGHRFACDVCGKAYSNPRTLRAHKIDQHSGSFQCQYCGAQFGREVVFYRHLEHIHTKNDERKLECPNKCPKRFKYPQVLRNHLRWGVCPNSVKALNKKAKDETLGTGVDKNKKKKRAPPNDIYWKVKKARMNELGLFAALASSSSAPELTIERHVVQKNSAIVHLQPISELQTMLETGSVPGTYVRMTGEEVTSQGSTSYPVVTGDAVNVVGGIDPAIVETAAGEVYMDVTNDNTNAGVAGTEPVESGVPSTRVVTDGLHTVIVETEDGGRHELALSENDLNAVMSGAQFQLV